MYDDFLLFLLDFSIEIQLVRQVDDVIFFVVVLLLIITKNGRRNEARVEEKKVG